MFYLGQSWPYNLSIMLGGKSGLPGIVFPKSLVFFFLLLHRVEKLLVPGNQDNSCLEEEKKKFFPCAEELAHIPLFCPVD